MFLKPAGSGRGFESANRRGQSPCFLFKSSNWVRGIFKIPKSVFRMRRPNKLFQKLKKVERARKKKKRGIIS